MSSEAGAAAELGAWLEAEGLPVAYGAGGLALDVTIPESGDRTIRVVELPEAGLLTLNMVSTVVVPRTRWSALYPLLADVNASIVMGAWVLDPDSGLLLYRMALPTRGAAYEQQALRDVISHVATIVRTFEDSFATAVGGDKVLAAWRAEDVD
jgi:hypothetical protein